MIEDIRYGIIISIRTSSTMNNGVAIEAFLYSFTSRNKVRIIEPLLPVARSFF